MVISGHHELKTRNPVQSVKDGSDGRKELRMQKKLVLHTLSKDGIENVGTRRHLRKLRYWFLIPAVLIAVCFLLVSFTENNNRTGEILFALSVLSFIVLYFKSIVAGRKFWKQVKDMPEPINLDEVK